MGAGKLAPLDWRTLARVFEADGYAHVRTKGSHRSYTKPGCLRPLIIPTYGEIGVDIIMSNMRSAAMSRKRYFELLAKVR